MRILVAVLVLVLAAPEAEAKCARMNLRPEVLTAEVKVPAGGGGIVVGTEGDWEHDEEGAAPQKGWGFLTGRDLAVPTITVIAPGLVVYGVPNKMRTTGELTDGKKVRAKLTITKRKVPLLPAPDVQTIITKITQNRRRNHTTTVTLRSAAPADAVALVVLEPLTKTPRSWGKASGTEIVVYQAGGCRIVPTGTIATKDGDRVMVAWLDRYGRLSPPSKSVHLGSAAKSP